MELIVNLKKWGAFPLPFEILRLTPNQINELEGEIDKAAQFFADSPKVFTPEQVGSKIYEATKNYLERVFREANKTKSALLLPMGVK